MSEEQLRRGWPREEMWSSSSSQSVTPDPPYSNINHEAPVVWECGNFDELSMLQFFGFDTTNLLQQSHVQLLDVTPRDGGPTLHARASACHTSVSPVPSPASFKRTYPSSSTIPYQQDTAHIFAHSTSPKISHGQSQFSRNDPRSPILNKRRRLEGAEDTVFRQNALSSDQKPEVTDKKDEEGRTRGQIRVFGKREKVRRSLTASETARTKKTRELTACGRCKDLKQRCDRPACGLMPCENCLKARKSEKARPGDALCIRVKLLDLNLHRNGSTDTPFLETWMSRQSIQSCGTSDTSHLDRRKIQLSQGIDGFILEVPVARYAIKDRDKTWYLWRDSNQEVQHMNMPAYYICDMQPTQETLFQNFGRDSTSKYVLSLLKDEGAIIKEAFREAHRLSQNSSLLRNSLNIWCGTRCTELTWTICGNDKLGILPPTESDNPWTGTVPVTPIMDTQLDEIAINSFLKPHAAQLLQELHHKMTNQDTTDWYEVFLSLIIILHNFQRISKDIKEYTSRHGMEKTSFPDRPSICKRNIFACKSLLAYFHFAYLGSRRFFSFMRKGPETESMPEEQQKFLQLLRRFMSKKDNLKDWQQRNMYHDSMFWINQLLVFDWRPDFETFTPIEDFTEEDLLTT